MNELMIGDVALPIGGFADGTETVQRDSLYLIHDERTTVSSIAQRQIPAVGSDFWRELGTARGELNALFRTLQRGDRSLYLMQCGPLPVLVMRYPYAADLSLLAAIPDGELAQALRTPAAYDGYLYPELQLSPLSASRKMPFDQSVCEQAREWLLPYMRLITQEVDRRMEASALLQWVTLRVFRLAHLCGVRVAYNFDGIGYGEVEGVNQALLVAQLLAIMFLASRVATDKLVYLGFERKQLPAEPLLYARMQLDDVNDPLSELESLRRVAAKRGTVLETFFDPARKGLLHLRFSFCAAKISVQQLRAFLGFRE